MNLPFRIDLRNKVIVITGAGGILCSHLAKAVAACGAKVALLDLNKEAAQMQAEEIVSIGGIAKAYQANVLRKDSLEACHEQILKDFGSCDILINGAGGNNPKATTDNEFAEVEDVTKDLKTFFDLEQEGVEFVFNLNFFRDTITYSSFCKGYDGKKGLFYLEYLFYECLYALNEDTRL